MCKSEDHIIAKQTCTVRLRVWISESFKYDIDENGSQN